MQLNGLIQRALREDIGRRDITSQTVIPASKNIRAIILAKETCVVCGLGIAAQTFRQMDKTLNFKPLVREGAAVKKGKIIARLSGSARSILAAERVALNFLTFLSGIATKTNAYVKKVHPFKAKIMDTRKTLPGLRALEKYAVRVGGGFNHRLALDEMVLVKDNHIKVIGDRWWVVGLKKIKEKRFAKFKIEIEVKNLREFRKALKLNPNIIMLDNMNVKDIKSAVYIRNNLQLTTYNLQLKLEASGGITLHNVREIAATGVDMISIGDLTHSVDSVDMSLEILSAFAQKTTGVNPWMNASKCRYGGCHN